LSRGFCPPIQKNPKIKPELRDTYKQKGQRKKLVSLLRSKGISDAKVLEAILKIPRHQFVKYALHERAYENTALRIDEEQTISQPYTVAFQTQSLNIKPGQKVLEVGTGSGYQASVLAEMGADVFTIERIRKLHDKSKLQFVALGYFNIKSKFGDGFKGWPEEGPFDKIIVTASPENLPQALDKQLKIGGQMIIPVGSQSGAQEMLLRTRVSEDNFEVEEKGAFRFVPMMNEKENISRFKL